MHYYSFFSIIPIQINHNLWGTQDSAAMIFLTYNFQVENFLFVHAIDYGFTRIFSLIVHLKASKHQISTPTVGTFLHMDSAKKVAQIMVVYYCFFGLPAYLHICSIQSDPVLNLGVVHIQAISCIQARCKVIYSKHYIL